MKSKAFSPEILQAIINRYQKIKPRVNYKDKSLKKVGRKGWQPHYSEKANLQKKRSEITPENDMEDYMKAKEFDPEFQYNKETEFFRELDKTPISDEFPEERKKEYYNAIMNRMKTA